MFFFFLFVEAGWLGNEGNNMNANFREGFFVRFPRGLVDILSSLWGFV